MTLKSIILLLLCTLLPVLICAQEIVDLPVENSGTPEYSVAERSYYSKDWQTEVITNVKHPKLEVYRPDADNSNGMAVIIAPGGGYYAHSIEKEGREVAQWLAKKGVTAFVLKYRLVPTGEDGVADLSKEWQIVESRVMPIQPLAQKDGLSAIAHVREKAVAYGIDPDKIGFMGFSAGGDVTVNVGLGFSESTRPNFIVPVYPWLPGKEQIQPPENAPSLLVICASDDPLDLAPGSVELYKNWLNAGYSSALVIYARGGHGFGMSVQNLPSDKWIDHFYSWAVGEGFVNKTK